MRISFIGYLMLVFILVPVCAFSQKTFTAQEYALVLSNKMKDSLLLSDIEYEQIHEANQKIQAAFIKVHNENSKTERSELQKKLGDIERSRDDWYKKILSDEKFKLYLTKKANLFKLN